MTTLTDEQTNLINMMKANGMSDQANLLEEEFKKLNAFTNATAWMREETTNADLERNRERITKKLNNMDKVKKLRQKNGIR